MPLVDLPAEELLSFQGRTPRPANFDAFWKEGLAYAQAMEAEVKLRPVKPEVPGISCFDLTFMGVGGAQIYAKYIRAHQGYARFILYMKGRVQWTAGQARSSGFPWIQTLQSLLAASDAVCLCRLRCDGHGLPGTGGTLSGRGRRARHHTQWSFYPGTG